MLRLRCWSLVPLMLWLSWLVLPPCCQHSVGSVLMQVLPVLKHLRQSVCWRMKHVPMYHGIPVIFQLGGVSICLCYTFQLTVFLPCLALNARRAFGGANFRTVSDIKTKPWDGLGGGCGHLRCTLPKTNSQCSPENQWLEDEIPFLLLQELAYFQG